MSTKSALAELRRNRQCIERVIRALELLQQLEDNADSVGSSAPDDDPAKVVEIHTP